MLVRAVVRPQGARAAAEWLSDVASGRVEGLVPDLVFAETAQAFAGYVRNGQLSERRADELLHDLLDLPLETTSLRKLARPALKLSLNRRVSAYDSCYLALARAAEAVLVTADRRLAELAERSALLPDAQP